MWYMNEERKMLQKMMREFVKNEVKPFVHKMEVEEEYPREIIRKLGEMGILGLVAPEEHGGLGVDRISFGIAIEEIAKESNVIALLTCLNSDWHAGAALDASPEQIEQYFKPLFRGEKIMAAYVTEPGGGLFFPGHTTKATPDGDGWVINGTKVLGTTNGANDCFMVYTMTDKYDPVNMTGITLFLIPSDREGVKFGRNENKLGWHGSNTGTLYLDNVRVTKEDMLGQYNLGAISNHSYFHIQGLCDYGVLCLGSAEGVWERTRKFLGERMQGGVSLWDAHQHIRVTMAEMWCEIENYRAAAYTALQNRQNGEDVLIAGVALKSAGAKLLESVASKCITLHGGTGTVFETDIERFYRDAPMNTVGCGSVMTLKDQIAHML